MQLAPSRRPSPNPGPQPCERLQVGLFTSWRLHSDLPTMAMTMVADIPVAFVAFRLCDPNGVGPFGASAAWTTFHVTTPVIQSRDQERPSSLPTDQGRQTQRERNSNDARQARGEGGKSNNAASEPRHHGKRLNPPCHPKRRWSVCRQKAPSLDAEPAVAAAPSITAPDTTRSNTLDASPAIHVLTKVRRVDLHGKVPTLARPRLCFPPRDAFGARAFASA